MPDTKVRQRSKWSQTFSELWHRLKLKGSVSVSGSGAVAASGGVSAGEKGIAVGGHVYGDVYHVYQSSPGPKALTQNEFGRVLGDYLRWVQNAYSKARLYGLESLQTAQGRPVRDLSQVFVPVSLRQFQPPRRDEIEWLTLGSEVNTADAFGRFTEGRQKKGAVIPLHRLLTLKDKVAIVGGPGSGKSTVLAYLASSLSAAAQAGKGLSVDIPHGKNTLVPLLIPLRYFSEYISLCEQSPLERLNNPRAGTLAGFIPWYLKRRSPALETSEDFFDRLLLGSGCLLMLDG